MPEATLPNGTVVQTGTVGALLVNIKAYNKAHAAGDTAQLEQLKPKLESSIPLLMKVGMFELFEPDEWIQGDNVGRTVVGELAKNAGA